MLEWCERLFACLGKDPTARSFILIILISSGPQHKLGPRSKYQRRYCAVCGTQADLQLPPPSPGPVKELLELDDVVRW